MASVSCPFNGLVNPWPEVFEMGDDMAQVIVSDVPAGHEEAAQQADDECLVEAIIVE